MGPSGKTYEIRTVADFLEIPAGRRELCIVEFVQWCALMEGGADIAKMMGVAKIEIGPRDVYRWIDDDKGIAHMKLKTMDGPLTPISRARVWLTVAALVAAFLLLCYLIRLAFASFGDGPIFGA